MKKGHAAVFFQGETAWRTDKNNPLYGMFIAHPELNASAIARRLRMSQGLFA